MDFMYYLATDCIQLVQSVAMILKSRVSLDAHQQQTSAGTGFNNDVLVNYRLADNIGGLFDHHSHLLYIFGVTVPIDLNSVLYYDYIVFRRQ